ncbi:MAG: glycoside hydrolase family 31 protein [Verrucomicrobia bacterium]|nr:glycoside hydrolase family 31 protein [Verrucomicrobiota bacterium]
MRAGYLKRLRWSAVAVAVVTVLLVYFGFALPFWGVPFNASRHGRSPLTPAWALEPWIWEDDHVTEAFTLELVNGYLEHDFPVGAVLIDSPWSTRYNDFVPDPTTFPNLAQLIRDLGQRGIRVVLWMTCMVNSQNKDTSQRDATDWHAAAAQAGYLVGGEHQARWWKGRGGFLDYTSPAAVAWWRGLQQPMLDLGVAGWKLDGTATLLHSRLGPVPVPYHRAARGLLSTRRYMDHYYRDEYRHGLERNPEFVTLSRSLDSPMPWSHPEGFAPVDASPVNWVGDNTHTWGAETRGLERAIQCILRSAKLGYSVIGSDVAGYHGPEPIPAELYIRWAQFSAFCGLFLHGGHGERRLWLRSPVELELVRQYQWLHSELVPYLYSHVVEAHRGGPVPMRPLRAGKYQYLLGDDLLIAPIYREGPTREVVLPRGRWRYWSGDLEVLEGGQAFTRDYPIGEYPVYVRDGAILPMNVRRPYTGIGARDWEGLLTLNLYPRGTSQFTVEHPDGSGALRVTVRAGPPLEVELVGVAKPHLLRVLCPQRPTYVRRGDAELAEQGQWAYDAVRQRLIVRCATALEGTYTIGF